MNLKREEDLQISCKKTHDEDTLVPILEIIMDEATASKTADLVNPSYVELKNATLKYVNRVVPHAENQDKSARGVGQDAT